MTLLLSKNTGSALEITPSMYGIESACRPMVRRQRVCKNGYDRLRDLIVNHGFAVRPEARLSTPVCRIGRRVGCRATFVDRGTAMARRG
jgi:hypothetical protein